ncbi:hypothetical protein N665_0932s0028 [Sinapis alba]|nr:hypothetical protein N665_0932s0028 [Sinapis alba]
MAMITFLLVVAMITATDVVSGEKEVVLDSEGNPVKANAAYFISHSNPYTFITRYNGHHRFIMRKPFSQLNPEPVLFSTRKKDVPRPVIFGVSSDVVASLVVRVSTELHIKFRDPGHSSSGIWRVANNSSPIKTVVMPRSWSLDEEATFTIQKLKGGYGFAFGRADKPVPICAKVVGVSYLSRLRLSNLSQVNMSCFPPVKFIPAK